MFNFNSLTMTRRFTQVCYALILCLPLNTLSQQFLKIISTLPKAIRLGELTEILIWQIIRVLNTPVPIGMLKILSNLNTGSTVNCT